MNQACWYCNKLLGKCYWKVVGMKGKYCRKCAFNIQRHTGQLIYYTCADGWVAPYREISLDDEK